MLHARLFDREKTELGDKGHLGNVRLPLGGTEMSLREIPYHEQLLSTLWTESMAGAAIVDEEGRFVSMNPRFLEIVEYSEAELVGKTFQEITVPSDLKADIQEAEKARRGDSDGYEMWKTYLKKSGLPVQVHLKVRKILTEDGRFAYFLSQVLPHVNVTSAESDREIRMDVTLLVARFIRDNSKQILALVVALTGVLTALATYLAQLLKG